MYRGCTSECVSSGPNFSTSPRTVSAPADMAEAEAETSPESTRRSDSSRVTGGPMTAPAAAIEKFQLRLKITYESGFC